MSDYSAENLTIQIVPPLNKYQVVEFRGEMDKAGLTEVKGKLEALIENYSLQYLVFDFGALDYINSESIGFLMAIHSHLVKTGKALVVVNAKANVKDIFQVIGLFSVVSYYDTLNQFVEKIGA